MSGIPKSCEYIKTGKGYVAACGIKIRNIGRGWMYCPRCGKYIVIMKEGRR